MIKFISHLFNYSFARCVAEHFNLKLEHLSHEPWPWISSGNEFIIKDLFDLDFNENGKVIDGIPKEYSSRHLQPIEEIDGTKPIILSGWYERFDQLEKYKNELRTKWIKPKHSVLKLDGVGIHVRLGDREYYRICHESPIKKQYFIDAIEILGGGNIFWFSDQPYSETIKELQETCGGQIIFGNFEEDFLRLMSFKKIIICDSTYSSWAAWLSQADKIVVFKKGQNKYGGIWQKTFDAVDYWPNEDRYIYI